MRMQRKFISILLLIAMLLSMTITSAAITPTTDEIVDKATEVIISSEGTYKSVNPDDNGALSIGCIQWHATRALNLLKDIVNADPNAAYHKKYNKKKTSKEVLFYYFNTQAVPDGPKPEADVQSAPVVRILVLETSFSSDLPLNP